MEFSHTAITTVYALGASAGILIASIMGVMLAWTGLRKFFEHNLPYLVSFSAGIFLVVVWSLVGEMREVENNHIVGMLIIALGALISHGITRLFPGSHHHESKDCAHTHSHINIRNMFVGDSFHSLVDGIMLAPAFLISPILGISASIGIAFHEVVQELSEFFVYKKSGFSTRKAIKWCFYSSLPIIPGALIGLYLTEIKWLIIPLIGLATGSFLYIVLTDLIPESYAQARSRSKYIKHILFALIGVAIMLLIA